MYNILYELWALQPKSDIPAKEWHSPLWGPVSSSRWYMHREANWLASNTGILWLSYHATSIAKTMPLPSRGWILPTFFFLPIVSTTIGWIVRKFGTNIHAPSGWIVVTLVNQIFGPNTCKTNDIRWFVDVILPCWIRKLIFQWCENHFTVTMTSD